MATMATLATKRRTGGSGGKGRRRSYESSARQPRRPDDVSPTPDVDAPARAGSWDALPAGSGGSESWAAVPPPPTRVGPIETLIWLAPATDIASAIPPPPPAPPEPGFGADFGAFAPAGHPLEAPTGDDAPPPPPPPQAEPLPIMFTPRVAWPTGSETQWRCEITWQSGYLKSEFRVEALAPGAKRQRTIAASPAFKFLFKDQAEVPVPQLVTPVRDLMKDLEREGWTPVSRGGRWYSFRFLWNRPGSPPGLEGA